MAKPKLKQQSQAESRGYGSIAIGVALAVAVAAVAAGVLKSSPAATSAATADNAGRDPSARASAEAKGSPIDVFLWANGGNNTVDGARSILASVSTLSQLHAAAKSAFATLRPAQTLRSDESLVLFAATGRYIRRLADVGAEGVVVMVPSHEYFIWPGWAVGHKVTVHGARNAIGGPLVLETVALQPRAFVVEHLISASEAAYIIKVSEKDMFRSGTYQSDGNGGHVDEAMDDRTSSQAWVDARNSDPALQALYRRVSAVTKTPVALGSGLQALRYYPGQHYHSHYDYFDPAVYAKEVDYFHGRNRFITVLMYLSDVDGGGQTVFPKAGPTGYQASESINWGDCTRGVAVTPAKGKALVFYNLLANGHMEGALDKMSLHAGCDVTTGVKYACNAWLYNKHYGDGPDALTGYMNKDVAKEILL